MDAFSNLATGFAAAASFQNLGFALIGCLLGTLIGVLPGIGPIPTIAMLLPITFGLDPLSSLIMLAGIYYGAQYGGSTTSILVNMPGEASSVVTCMDGYQMARQGRAGAALSVAALGSFFAGCVGTLFIAAFGPPLAALAQQFNSPDYFSLMLLGLLMAVVLAHGSVIKAIAMVVVGLLLGLVGTDVNSGAVRYTFGVSELWDGIDFLPMVIGMFGVVEIIRNLEEKEIDRTAISTKFRDLWPSSSEFAQSWKPALRGTVVGSILGILPGGGAVLASFASYTVEKKVAKDPSRFGKGAIEGVAGPETANNAAAQTSFIPLLTLGLPSNPIMALMMGAMMIQGIQPGAAVMTSRPDLFWGMVASMWIGNLMLVVINLPMIGIWVKLLSIPYRFLFPAILLFCVIGVYGTNASATMMIMTAAFAVFGYVMVRFGCEPAPMILGFLLGPLMEENLRRSLVLSRGDPMIFLQRPISLTLLVCAILVLLMIVLPNVRKSREMAFQEGS
ncbi:MULTISPECIES: tripartite tricarboxylate transporter permease [unclassified Beijerinckia]|uniref:tripartite tricarboxylate transporter permease n=1 Tax=unclassified Beijerinckia TaxID=2638183 RepID=UPI000894ACFE|nr:MULTISPECIES: tripartite tricarboxylate transporter permease [unclassified Beijerinckia]MDH7799409.1 putative tricarboxylic transport membrane protein [Beijerinckia sp. GAS462]SED49411.1 TctA family transporter [Beijerinckia sp. 28-YEA-48]